MVAIERTCPVCGETFCSTRNNKTYCTRTCKDRAHTLRRIWPSRGKVGGGTFIIDCPRCHSVVVENTSRAPSNKQYCSLKCAEEARAERGQRRNARRREQTRLHPAMLTRECAHCRSAFTYKAHGGARRKYCTKKCANAAEYQRERDRNPEAYAEMSRRKYRRRYADPEQRARAIASSTRRMHLVHQKAKAFDAMYEPVQTWWSLIKDALENRTELPEPPVYEEAITA